MSRQVQASGKGGSQRQLRVGELVRHAVADILARGGIHDPVIETHLDHRAGGAHVAGPAARHRLRDAARRHRRERRARGARAQQALSARRGRASREPEIRPRHPLPDRRAVSRGGAHRAPPAYRRRCSATSSGRMAAPTTSSARPNDLDHDQACGRGPGRAGRPVAPPRRPAPPAGPKPKREKHDVHGWVVLDKPVGMTSTHAVSVIKRLFTAKRAGHAGTLDPLASGCLPIALGDATKTVPFVMDGRKAYSFTVRWGEERDTDDAEGRVVATSDRRPTAEEIVARASRASSAPSSRCRRAIPRSRSKASAPTTSPATARSSSSSRGPSTSSGSSSKRWPMPTTAVSRRMRQGNLCPRARPRSRPAARLLRPRVGAAAHRGRAVRRKRHDFAGRARIFMP